MSSSQLFGKTGKWDSVRFLLESVKQGKINPVEIPKVEVKKQVQKMTPVASKPAPQKAVAPTPKAEAKPVEATPVETFKPKTESSSKKGIDAALDGLE